MDFKLAEYVTSMSFLTKVPSYFYLPYYAVQNLHIYRLLSRNFLSSLPFRDKPFCLPEVSFLAPTINNFS